MSNLIQQKTTSATGAQHASTLHQQCPQEALVKGLARLLRTPEAATYVGLSARTMEKHRTYGTGLCNRGSRCLGRAGDPTLNFRSGSGHCPSCQANSRRVLTLWQ